MNTTNKILLGTALVGAVVGGVFLARRIRRNCNYSWKLSCNAPEKSQSE